MQAEVHRVGAASRVAAPGKYLTFRLGDEAYGLPVLKVREIVHRLETTLVPRTPPYVCGVANLRGKIIPVVDLRVKLGLAPGQLTERTCTVVVEVEPSPGHPCVMGLRIDGVDEVVNIDPGAIEGTPDFGGSVATEFILGLATLKGQVTTLLDLDRMLGSAAPPPAGPNPAL